MKRPQGLTLVQWIKTVRAQVLFEMTLNPNDWLILDQTDALGLAEVLNEISDEVANLERRAATVPEPPLPDNVLRFMPVRRLTTKRPHGGGDAA